MAIRLADTARPNNYVDNEHLGTFPVAYAEDVWFSDGTRLSEKTFDGQSIQVTELPLASATEEGHVYQYLGTTGTYTHGCFYECVEQSGNYDWKILQTVENCVFYTDRNLVDSTVYPVGTTMVYTGEPQWGFFKGHHYMYDENKTLTLYKFDCNYNGARVSVVFTDKELKVGTPRLRDFDGYIVDYISEINGDTVTVVDRGGSTSTLTDLVYAEETEDITFTGWFDIGGGGSGDGGTDYEEFIGTQAEWDALSQSEKNKYDGKIVNITDDESGIDSFYPSAPTTPEIVFDKLNQSSNIDSTYTVTKKAFYIVRVHTYSEGQSHSASVYLNGVNIGAEQSYCDATGVGYTTTIPCNVGDTIRMVVSCGGSGTYDKRSAAIYRLD